MTPEQDRVCTFCWTRKLLGCEIPPSNGSVSVLSHHSLYDYQTCPMGTWYLLPVPLTLPSTRDSHPSTRVTPHTTDSRYYTNTSHTLSVHFIQTNSIYLILHLSVRPYLLVPIKRIKFTKPYKPGSNIHPFLVHFIRSIPIYSTLSEYRKPEDRPYHIVPLTW